MKPVYNEKLKKKMLIAAFLGSVILLSVGFFGANQGNVTKSAEIPNQGMFYYPNSAYVAHDPIVIDGNTALDAFCAGNGTSGLNFTSAHVITNYLISEGDESGIRIENTDRFLNLTNHLIQDFKNSPDAGIWLRNCSNVHIEGSELRDNYYGIWIEASSNISITGNYLPFNRYGIHAKLSKYISIDGNEVAHSDIDGLKIEGGEDFFISNNDFNHNYNGISSTRIYFEGEYEQLSNITIKNNQFELNEHIALGLSYTENSSLSNNTFLDNFEIAFYMYSSIRNVITNNVVENCDDGIRLHQSDQNNISLNLVKDCNRGITLDFAEQNVLGTNNISECNTGMEIVACEYNYIVHNNITGNNIGVVIDSSYEVELINNSITLNFEKTIFVSRSERLVIEFNTLVFTYEDFAIVSGEVQSAIEIHYKSDAQQQHIIRFNTFEGYAELVSYHYIETPFPPELYYVIPFSCLFFCGIIIYFSSKKGKARHKKNKAKRNARRMVRRQRRVVDITVVNTKKMKYLAQIKSAERKVKNGQKCKGQAAQEIKFRNYKKARYLLTKAEKKHRRALKIHPDFATRENIHSNLSKIRQLIPLIAFSQAFSYHKDAWVNFENKFTSTGINLYKKSVKSMEQAIKNIEEQEKADGNFKSPIQSDFLYQILEFYNRNLQQFQGKTKKRSRYKPVEGNMDLEELNERITDAIKETNEVLWIYDHMILSAENPKDLHKLTALIDEKLAKTAYMLASVQERMKYLEGYLKTKGGRFSQSTGNTVAVSLKRAGRPEIDEVETEHLRILREYEYIGGKIRLKVGVVNLSETVITNVAIRFDFPQSLKWIIHEPNYARRGDTIHIPKVGVGEKIAISLYLEPINCLQSPVNATLTYFDVKDHPKAIIMKPKMVSVTCPIFFTKEDANPARVKNLIEELKYHDRKVFPLQDQEKSELVFNKMMEVIGMHDIKLVQKHFNPDILKGEALFYGITKVKQQKMVVQLELDAKHHSLQIEVAGDDQGPITGLLAELECQIREKLVFSHLIQNEEKFGDMRTSVLLGQCPYCSAPLSAENIEQFKTGNTVACTYCDVSILPY